jgi:hypothetical protein
MSESFFAVLAGWPVGDAILTTQIRQSISYCRNQILPGGPFEDLATAGCSNLENSSRP